MDIKVRKTVKEISQRILIFDVLSIIVLFLIGYGQKSFILGILIGSLVAIINFNLMARNLWSSLEKTKVQAGLSYYAGFILRYVLAGVVLVLAAKTHRYSLITTAIGLFSTQIVIYFDRLVLKKIRKEGAR